MTTCNATSYLSSESLRDGGLYIHSDIFYLFLPNPLSIGSQIAPKAHTPAHTHLKYTEDP